MRAKVAQEKVIREARVPFTIVHSTQFMSSWHASPTRAPKLASSAPRHPGAADRGGRGAGLAATVATAPPAHRVVEIAGPELFAFEDAVARVLAAQGDGRRGVADPGRSVLRGCAPRRRPPTRRGGPASQTCGSPTVIQKGRPSGGGLTAPRRRARSDEAQDGLIGRAHADLSPLFFGSTQRQELVAVASAAAPRAPARDEQRTSGDELQSRALVPECDRLGGGDAVVVDRGAGRLGHETPVVS